MEDAIDDVADELADIKKAIRELTEQVKLLIEVLKQG